MRKALNTIWTRAENGQNPNQKTLSRYLWNPQKHLLSLAKSGFGNIASESLEQQNTSPKPRTAKHATKLSQNQPRTTKHKPKASNSKTRSGLGALDPKSPKHHLDTSRKRPKPEWNPQKHLLGLAKSDLGPPLPKASNSKTQAQSLAQQNTLQNCRKISFEQQNTSPKASNSKTRSGLGALDPKSPKHHLDTSRKRPKPEPKNSFTLPLESTKTSFGPRLAKSGLGTPPPRAANSKTQARKPRTTKHAA